MRSEGFGRSFAVDIGQCESWICLAIFRAELVAVLLQISRYVWRDGFADHKFDVPFIDACVAQFSKEKLPQKMEVN